MATRGRAATPRFCEEDEILAEALRHRVDADATFVAGDTPEGAISDEDEVVATFAKDTQVSPKAPARTDHVRPRRRTKSKLRSRSKRARRGEIGR
eukprot:1726539-Pyramimonas_sp.AAC.1